ncbi:3-oxoacyl-[acyl-carrier-protein] synthase 3 [Terasakiella brassicae]|uniref:Beta-ketoacyl-[acyl-carrier-protein] synthase III n=1 Tax=Terasakiella brassicae TaxID=1634917 RepID=A0A917C6Y1_9PROT|nr:beta-ketoacyl-ACP synthase III [Terasakiella brassicae]GGF70896.1 3-oxoacyl-[acyl-carrier-protein] synthase 3 [Terasakiella brassicae]
MALRSRILGCGSYLPEKIVTNDDLAKFVDTSDDWITARTGIKQRHMVTDGELTSDLARKAALNAIEHAGIDVQDIDLIVLGTTTPDNTFPSTATKVQAQLGLTHGFAMDVQAVCSGFMYALATADSFLKTKQAKTALVIGAESFTRLLDWEDRTTCVLFGDGAGAVILRAEEETAESSGILSTHLHSDGRYQDILMVDGGPSSTQTTGYVRMAGKEVFRHAVVNLAEVVKEALAANDLTADDIDWIVPHQANKRILDGTAKKLKVDPNKVVVTVDKHANTSAASIPLALDEAVRDGRIKRGDLLIIEAMGGGLTWGSALIRW